MTNKVLYYFSFVLLLSAVSFTGCGGGISSANITMTTTVEDDVALGLAGTGTAVIDWDDGSVPETVTLKALHENGISTTSYYHTFSGTTSRTIAIKGENITHLECRELELKALDVSKNTALTELNCFINRLTSLDIS